MGGITSCLEFAIFFMIDATMDLLKINDAFLSFLKHLRVSLFAISLEYVACLSKNNTVAFFEVQKTELR